MASYPIAPWLQPRGDPASAFVGGYRAGADVALERQKLKQHAAEANMQAQARADALQQEVMREEHKIALEAAYQNAQLGLRQQALEQQEHKIALDAQQAMQVDLRKEREMAFDEEYKNAQLGISQQMADQGGQRNQLSAQRAAQSFQAQQEYRTRIAGGEDAAKVLLELGPLISGDMTGMASLAKAPNELIEPGAAEEVEGLPDYMRVRKGPQSYQYIQKPDAPSSAVPVAQPIEGAPGMIGIKTGKSWQIRSLPKQTDSPEVKRLRKRLSNLEAIVDPEKEDLKVIESVKKQLSEAEAKNTIKAAPSAPGAAPKRYIYNPQTGQLEPKK